MFFFLPVGVDYQARRYPVVTFVLMGLCTVVFFAALPASQPSLFDPYPWAFQHLWLIPAQSYWWTYLTSMFVHGGFMHLLGNMVYLFLFGSCVEDLIGRWRYTIFYVLCGLASEFTNIAFSADHFASEIPLGGASGAISGCIGGFLLLLPRTRIEFKWFFWFWFRFWAGEFYLPAWLVIAGWFLRDFAGLMIAQLKPAHGGIAFGAHVCGTLFGAAVLASRKLWLKDSEAEDEDAMHNSNLRDPPVTGVPSIPVY